MSKCCKRIRTVISCIHDGTTESPEPIGFSWANTLATMFKGKYKLTVLLHGECLKYGLTNDVYQNSYGSPNPFANLLQQFSTQYHIKIVICNLCLTNDGFNASQLLSFVKPIAFSIDFIAESQAKKHAVIVYDAKLTS
jgi:hypothetical protein